VVNPFCAKGRSSPLLSAGMRASWLAGGEAPGGTRHHDNNTARLKFLESLPEKQAFFYDFDNDCYALKGGENLSAPQVLWTSVNQPIQPLPGEKVNSHLPYTVNVFARPKSGLFFWTTPLSLPVSAPAVGTAEWGGHYYTMAPPL